MIHEIQLLSLLEENQIKILVTQKLSNKLFCSICQFFEINRLLLHLPYIYNSCISIIALALLLLFLLYFYHTCHTFTEHEFLYPHLPYFYHLCPTFITLVSLCRTCPFITLAFIFKVQLNKPLRSNKTQLEGYLPHVEREKEQEEKRNR